MHHRPTSKLHAAGRAPHAGDRGSALIEMALVLPFILMLLMAVIDFGHLIQTRLIITNVSREGGSIASRAPSIDSGLTDMVLASGTPLNLAGADGRVYITRIQAGPDANSPSPTIATQISGGSLAEASRISGTRVTLGLTQRLYDHLVFDPANGTADISQVTVVEVIYKYRPITPLPNFIPGLLDADSGGLLIASKAVF
jgi:hypothetical protein